MGAGKYGKAALEAMVATRADTLMLIVLNGHSGSGFSFAHSGTAPQLERVPAILREVADSIERDLTALDGRPS